MKAPYPATPSPNTSLSSARWVSPVIFKRPCKPSELCTLQGLSKAAEQLGHHPSTLPEARHPGNSTCRPPSCYVEGPNAFSEAEETAGHWNTQRPGPRSRCFVWSPGSSQKLGCRPGSKIRPIRPCMQSPVLPLPSRQHDWLAFVMLPLPSSSTSSNMAFAFTLEGLFQVHSAGECRETAPSQNC